MELIAFLRETIYTSVDGIFTFNGTNKYNQVNAVNTSIAPGRMDKNDIVGNRME